MSNFVFNKFFSEFDVNKDGKISKLEMARFLRNFFDSPIGGEQAINSMVLLIFDQFDENRNGYIERKEALELLNEILAITEKPKATFSQFKKFFSEMDLNNDGVLQKNEIVRFVRKFLGTPLTELDVIIDTVNKIWYKFDVDRSGYLSRAETLRFLNDYLNDIGKPRATLS